MGITINMVAWFLLFLTGTVIYYALIATILPKYVLKIRCSVTESKDRGLKKYVFPSGRAVVYEPHPQIRKYVESYVLFTNGGYKYVKCRLKEGVRDIKYSIIMFNNENKVIDILEVNERVNDLDTDTLLIHQDTSYISFVLNSVAETSLKVQAPFYCRWKDLTAYVGLTSVLTLFEFSSLMLFFKTLDELVFETGLMAKVGFLHFVVPAVLVGIIAGGLELFFIRKRGVRWSK